MKKTISKVSELPSEFSLASYAASRAFEIQDWLVNLEFRSLRHQLRTAISEQKLSAKYLFENALLPESVCRAYLQDGLRRPFKDRQVTDQSVHTGLSGLYYRKDTRLAKYVEMFDLLLIEKLTDEQQEQRGAALQILDETPMWRALKEGSINTEGETEVSVNLNAPEDQLVEEFRSWVRETKAERGIDVPKRVTTKSDLDDLARYQVLPYLDLTFWAAAHEVEISNQLLGLALFPDEYELALSERVRKTVSPLALRAVTWDYCEYLRSQVVALGKGYKNLEFVPDEKKVLCSPVKVGREFIPDQ